MKSFPSVAPSTTFFPGAVPMFPQMSSSEKETSHLPNYRLSAGLNPIGRHFWCAPFWIFFLKKNEGHPPVFRGTPKKHTHTQFKKPGNLHQEPLFFRPAPNPPTPQPPNPPTPQPPNSPNPPPTTPPTAHRRLRPRGRAALPRLLACSRMAGAQAL